MATKIEKVKEYFPKGIRVSEGTIGCERHNKDILLSFNDRGGKFVDIFLDNETTLNLAIDIIERMDKEQIVKLLRDRKLNNLLKI
jgi:hypothetical protein